MNIEEAMRYIHKTEWQGSRPGLSRISALLAMLGNPQDSLSAIHIAGTNGKGSTSAMLASVLRAEGYRTALYTSPYLYRFGERIQVDGEPIPDDALCRVTERLRPLCDSMEDSPTEFELITAAAFLYFAEREVDYAVIEVGMGGRLDATNVLSHPLLSVVTGIALDHTAYLGDTVSAIAREKAGIFRSGTPAVAGMLLPEAAAVLAEEAARIGTTLTFAEEEALSDIVATPYGTSFSYRERREVRLPFAALYQPRNAALVLDACDALRKRGVRLSEESVRRGLATVSWPGRFEYFSHEPDVVFDGSHNPEGIAAAEASIRHLYGGRILLLTGVMRDKDYASMLDCLAGCTARVFAVRPDNPRALPAAELAEAWRERGIPATPYSDVGEAMKEALREAREEGLPLFILGSLYLYREAKDAFDAAKEELGL